MKTNTATPLTAVAKQGRKAPILAIASLPKWMDDLVLEMPQSRRQRTNEEVASLLGTEKQKAGESFPAYLDRLAFEDVKPVTTTIKELRSGGTVSQIPFALGTFQQAAGKFFRGFILKNAINKAEIGYLADDDGVSATPTA